MTFAPGARLGPYEIVAPLGAGGMGEVYRAKDTRLGREVAIKVLPAEVASDPDRLRRFEQEAKAVSALNHPHIVTLRAFPLLERTCQPDQLLSVGRETLARAMHEAYLRQQDAAGQSAAVNPAMVPWEALPEELKVSNRRQAGDIGRKLAAIGCELRAMRGWEAEPFELTEGEVDRMAQMEHARWLEEKREAGWTYAPGPRDAESSLILARGNDRPAPSRTL
ncbi:MAG TPA: protein kinase [Thermoanaerobaculia bacterium]|nr:protein kinase [Thermoanaerobaculia bacterium]